MKSTYQLPAAPNRVAFLRLDLAKPGAPFVELERQSYSGGYVTAGAWNGPERLKNVTPKSLIEQDGKRWCPTTGEQLTGRLYLGNHRVISFNPEHIADWQADRAESDARRKAHEEAKAAFDNRPEVKLARAIRAELDLWNDKPEEADALRAKHGEDKLREIARMLGIEA